MRQQPLILYCLPLIFFSFSDYLKTSISPHEHHHHLHNWQQMKKHENITIRHTINKIKIYLHTKNKGWINFYIIFLIWNSFHDIKFSLWFFLIFMNDADDDVHIIAKIHACSFSLCDRWATQILLCVYIKTLMLLLMLLYLCA